MSSGIRNKQTASKQSICTGYQVTEALSVRLFRDDGNGRWEVDGRLRRWEIKMMEMMKREGIEGEGREREMGLYKQNYYKELVHVIIDAKKFQGLLMKS